MVDKKDNKEEYKVQIAVVPEFPKQDVTSYTSPDGIKIELILLTEAIAEILEKVRRIEKNIG